MNDYESVVWRGWMQNHVLYQVVPMKCRTVLPDEGFPVRSVVLNKHYPPFSVYCEPVDMEKRVVKGTHRVRVLCPCGRNVPFGRMSQHMKGHAKTEGDN